MCEKKEIQIGIPSLATADCEIHYLASPNRNLLSPLSFLLPSHCSLLP